MMGINVFPMAKTSALTTFWNVNSLSDTSANITGRITTQKGEPLTDAEIKVTGRTYKNLLFSRKSNESGEYSVNAIPPGNYDIEVKANGFQTARRENIFIPLGRRYIDFVMCDEN